MTTKTEGRHPFSELLTIYRARKRGLTQTRLAELAGYDQAILVRMAQGKKDLTGPSGRDRVLRLIAVLHDVGALTTLDEANALLAAARLPPLYAGLPNEAVLLKLLAPSPAQHGTGAPQPAGDGILYRLPVSMTALIGRATELRALSKLISAARLVTLTGSGGSGKTRLALEAARQCKSFIHGACFVDLAPVGDSGEVILAIAQSLQLREMPGQAMQDGMKRFLQSKSLLLVLDNFEHVLEAAPLITELLAHCPGLHVLCTSRETLRVYGEHRFSVEPLVAKDAVSLFVERARAVQRDFALTHTNASVLDAICQRVDRLPLAIELAAARMDDFGPDTLLAQLAPPAIDDLREDGARLDVLGDGPRDVHARHRTLRNTIDWSHDALSEPEKIVFRRLGVFVGGWEAEQAAHVANGQVIRQVDVLPVLSQLIRKSLVMIEANEASGGAIRYRFLETIRDYALQKLGEAGELESATRQHADAFARLAERAYIGVQASDQRQWLARLEQDYANLSAATRWSFGPAGDAIFGCRIASAMQLPWRHTSSHQSDLWRWVHQAFDALTDDMPARVHGGVWLGHTLVKMGLSTPDALPRLEKVLAYYKAADDAYGIADAQGQVGLALQLTGQDEMGGLRMLEDALARSRLLGSTLIEHRLLKDLAFLFQKRGDFERADALRLEAIDACRRSGDVTGLTMLLYEHANQLVELMKFEEALRYGEEAAQMAREINDPRLEMCARGIVTEVVRYLGDVPRAVALNEALLVFTRERLAPLDLWLPILLTAKSLNDAGNHQRAQLLLDELMTILHATVGATHGYYGHVFDALACAASSRGDARHSARLFGAADAEMAAANERRFKNNNAEIAPYMAKARAALGDEAYEAAYAEGRAMTLEQVIEVALSGADHTD